MNRHVDGTGSHAMVRLVFAALLLGIVGSTSCTGINSGGNILTHNLSEPLNGATIARVDINRGSGNLTIDRLTIDEPILASGTLQYYEKKGTPTRTVDSANGQVTLTLRDRDKEQPKTGLPWEACDDATEWQIHLNPAVPSAIIAYSGGGNLKFSLAGMRVTGLSADTGGGNVDVVLPDNAADLSVTAKTGGGNVTVEMGSGTTGSNAVNANSGAGDVVVRVPGGVAARIHATSGLGKVVVSPRFNQIDRNTYQSSDYDSAVNKVDITAGSGAGNVSVSTK